MVEFIVVSIIVVDDESDGNLRSELHASVVPVTLAEHIYVTHEHTDAVARK